MTTREEYPTAALAYARRDQLANAGLYASCHPEGNVWVVEWV